MKEQKSDLSLMFIIGLLLGVSLGLSHQTVMQSKRTEKHMIAKKDATAPQQQRTTRC